MHSAFRSYGEGHEVLLLRPRATAAAAAGWSAVALLRLLFVALVVVHSRFTYVLCQALKSDTHRCCCFKRFNRPFYASCSSGLF
jgi:hypothetical protein